jgi:hypothetical protein
MPIWFKYLISDIFSKTENDVEFMQIAEFLTWLSMDHLASVAIEKAFRILSYENTMDLDDFYQLMHIGLDNHDLDRNDQFTADAIKELFGDCVHSDSFMANLSSLERPVLQIVVC